MIRAWWYCPQEPPLSFAPDPVLVPAPAVLEEGEILDSEMVQDVPNGASLKETTHMVVDSKPESVPTSQNSLHTNGHIPLSLPPKPPSPVAPKVPDTPKMVHKKSTPAPPLPPAMPSGDLTTQPLPADAHGVSTTHKIPQQEDTNTTGSPPSPTSPAAETLAAEERLRQLVLASKRKQKQSAVPTPDPNPPPQPDARQPQAGTSAASLDDLAASFITETIQAVKPTVSSSSARLAALDEEIARRNLLLSKLSTAKTKEERVRLLLLLRQRDRKSMLSLAPNATRLPWSTFEMQECVLILSDDEDDEA